MTEAEASPQTPVWESVLLMRSLGYAAVAASGLAIGTFLSEDPLSLSLAEIPLLFGFLGAFFPLYLAYASCFHHPKELANPKGALMLAAFVSFLWCIVTLAAANWLGATERIAMPVVSALALSFLLAVIYGYVLVARYYGDEDGTVRHQLVWPVVFGVGLPIYFGAQFKTLQGSLQPLLVVAVLWLIAILSEPLLRKPWQFGGFLGSSYILAFVVSAKLEALPNLRILLIAIALSAYLAVFESWRLTWYKYCRHGAGDTVADYYKVTAFVLTLSGLAMPLLYVIFSFSILALFGSAMHFLAAFAVWFYASPSSGEIAPRAWNAWKLFFGFSFAALLLAGTVLNLPDPTTPLPILIVIGVGGLIALALWMSARFKIGQGERPGNYFLAFLVSGSTVLAAGIALFQISEVRKSYAFLIYTLYVVFGLLIVFREPLSRALLVVGRYMGFSAFLALFRIPTSLFVLVSTGAALMRYGEISWANSLAAVSFFFSAAAGFALNDYFDIDRDRINQPMRPLPAGVIDVNLARKVIQVGMVVAAIFSLGASLGTGRPEPILAFVGVVGYNYAVSRMGEMKWLLTGIICALPFIFVTGVSGGGTGLFCLAVVLFVGGREVLMDIIDIPGDSRADIRTLPRVVGKSVGELIAGVLQLSGIAFLSVFAMQKLGAAAFVILVPLILTTMVLWVRWWRSGIKGKRRVVDQLWYPIGLGVALLLG